MEQAILKNVLKGQYWLLHTRQKYINIQRWLGIIPSTEMSNLIGQKMLVNNIKGNYKLLKKKQHNVFSAIN